MTTPALDWRQAITEAHARIARYLLLTPCIDLPIGALGAPYRLTLKLEHLQRTGSFKPRGVFNRLSGATLPPAGLICASGGNHGAALAYAAQTLGVPCEVFVPKVASQFKRDRLLAYGARVIEAGKVFVEALQASELRREETSAMSIHPFDHVQTLAGQGTVAKEIEEQVGVPDAVIVAVGGGGLLGGVAGWFGRSAAVIGAEPELCATFSAAMAAGKPVPVPTDGVAADALGCRELGSVPFSVVSERSVASLLVSDAEIVAAQRLLWEELRLVVEPAAAVPLAAARSGRLRVKHGAHVCLVICGGNVEPSTMEAHRA